MLENTALTNTDKLHISTATDKTVLFTISELDIDFKIEHYNTDKISTYSFYANGRWIYTTHSIQILEEIIYLLHTIYHQGTYLYGDRNRIIGLLHNYYYELSVHNYIKKPVHKCVLADFKSSGYSVDKTSETIQLIYTNELTELTEVIYESTGYSYSDLDVGLHSSNSYNKEDSQTESQVSIPQSVNNIDCEPKDTYIIPSQEVLTNTLTEIGSESIDLIYAHPKFRSTVLSHAI